MGRKAVADCKHLKLKEIEIYFVSMALIIYGSIVEYGITMDITDVHGANVPSHGTRNRIDF